MPEHCSQGEETQRGTCYRRSVLPISLQSPAELETESLILASVSVQGPRISRKCANFAVSKVLARVKSGVKNVPDPHQWVRTAVLLLLLPGAGQSGEFPPGCYHRHLSRPAFPNYHAPPLFTPQMNLVMQFLSLSAPKQESCRQSVLLPAPGLLPECPLGHLQQGVPTPHFGNHREHPLPPVFAQLVATESSAQLWT